MTCQRFVRGRALGVLLRHDADLRELGERAPGVPHAACSAALPLDCEVLFAAKARFWQAGRNRHGRTS